MQRRGFKKYLKSSIFLIQAFAYPYFYSSDQKVFFLSNIATKAMMDPLL
ncbi:hypothetical protein DJ66_0092 [Candidatus Liberibacter solanacearum]|uniref:Uncharacterized protein n=1 Tax=Candidatus Liberibacter solanacearum TaxID=556287 RepID=A0A0F4VMH6_9HYPH|nr:hypothetical protein DJ66_0092 [Candidatus Liberibacter solanacearum]